MYSTYFHCRYGGENNTMRHLVRTVLHEGLVDVKLIETDQQTITVQHQFTFSSFSPGRKNLLDNFVNPIMTEKNATGAQLTLAHSDWEQWSELPRSWTYRFRLTY
jgi:hypothetical protein